MIRKEVLKCNFIPASSFLDSYKKSELPGIFFNLTQGITREFLQWYVIQLKCLLTFPPSPVAE